MKFYDSIGIFAEAFSKFHEGIRLLLILRVP